MFLLAEPAPRDGEGRSAGSEEHTWTLRVIGPSEEPRLRSQHLWVPVEMRRLSRDHRRHQMQGSTAQCSHSGVLASPLPAVVAALGTPWVAPEPTIKQRASSQISPVTKALAGPRTQVTWGRLSPHLQEPQETLEAVKKGDCQWPTGAGSPRSSPLDRGLGATAWLATYR